MKEDSININSTNKKVLFADPDIASCYLVSEVLSEHDIEIIHAKCSLDAIRILRKNPFIDVVITEIKIPGVEGFGILKIIREINPCITVIAQTACVHNNMRQRCMMAGFNEYISKPIDLKLFVEMVKKYALFSTRKD
jgi:CheY-like chemotaxis protein